MMYKQKNNSGFFSTVFKLNYNQRKNVFYALCIPCRLFVGTLFLLFKDNLALSLVATIWGLLWLLFMVRFKRWEDNSDTPPWWKGLQRVSWRFFFSSMLVAFGFVGIVSSSVDERKRSNIIISIVLFADVFHGFFDRTIFWE